MFRRRTSSPGKDSVIPREGGRPRPSGLPRPTTAPPVLFGFSGIVFDRISKNHIFGTKLQSCLETYYIK